MGAHALGLLVSEDLTELETKRKEMHLDSGLLEDWQAGGFPLCISTYFQCCYQTGGKEKLVS